MKNGCTGDQYRVVRVVFGLYLFVHFVQLTPWGVELFSNRGALADRSASPLLYLFPNILAVWDGPIFVTAFLVLAALLSMCFAVGDHDRPAAVMLWYIWACLHGRMPLMTNPSLPYVGWMLLAHASLPRRRAGAEWHMPEGIFAVGWILMAVGYSYSGIMKLTSASWLDGSAVMRVLENPLARPGVARDAILACPDVLLRLATWAILGLELGFAPLALVGRLRPWLWAMMLMLHVSLIALIDFADLSLGMVMLHLWTFDPGWLSAVRRRRSLDEEEHNRVNLYKRLGSGGVNFPAESSS